MPPKLVFDISIGRRDMRIQSFESAWMQRKNYKRVLYSFLEMRATLFLCLLFV